MLVAYRGDQVSFYTTVGVGDVFLKDKPPPWLKTSYGKKYGAVMAELRTKFPSCTNFVITEIDWEA